MISATHRVESGGPNEDRVLVERRGQRTLAVVCDGAGNGGRGGLAADMAITVLAQQTGFLDCHKTLLSLDQKIHREAQGGETTCVLVEIGDDGALRVASVGDPDAWMLGRRSVELTQGQDKMKLGSGRCAPKLFKCQLMGQLLVATDGLLKYRPAVELAKYARRGLDALIERVRLKSGSFPDDIAAILLE
jgi:hypothetical protein